MSADHLESAVAVANVHLCRALTTGCDEFRDNEAISDKDDNERDKVSNKCVEQLQRTVDEVPNIVACCDIMAPLDDIGDKIIGSACWRR